MPATARSEALGDDWFDLAALGQSLVRHRRLVLAVIGLVTASAATVAIMLPPVFTATTSFVVDSQTRTSLPSSLGGLAQQFGLPIPYELNRSPRFYSELVLARPVLETVLDRAFVPLDLGDSARLVELLQVGGRTAQDSIANGIQELRRRISVEMGAQTGIVRVSVTLRDPVLAASVANELVILLGDFESETRQTRARVRRRFIETRIEQQRTVLASLEDRLRRFYERNRSWEQSPELKLQQAVLVRETTLQQDIYLVLSREYETARIEEVNDTPVLTVLEPAAVPTRKSGPRVTLFLAFALIAGTAAGFLISWFVDFVATWRWAPKNPA